MADKVYVKLDATTAQATTPAVVELLDLAFAVSQLTEQRDAAVERMAQLQIARDSYDPLIAETQAAVVSLQKQLDELK